MGWAGLLWGGILSLFVGPRTATCRVSDPLRCLLRTLALLLDIFQRPTPSLGNPASETGRGVALGWRFVGLLPLKRCVLYPKRDGEIGINLLVILVLEVRKEYFLDALDGILCIRDGIEGDSC